MTLESLTAFMATGWWYAAVIALLVILLVRSTYRRVADSQDTPTFTGREGGAVLSPALFSLPLLFLPSAFAWAVLDTSAAPGVPTLALAVVVLAVTAVSGLAIARRPCPPQRRLSKPCRTARSPRSRWRGARRAES
ncbi:hypothetical protein [Streptomyces sp. NPDC051183]|uniref:hypothetical protein n=1 Tax=Streptomyces sp. NPDC051183 TaxID=3155165 RepID=UPI00341A359F